MIARLAAQRHQIDDPVRAARGAIRLLPEIR
jgi:hypothetical protein